MPEHTTDPVQLPMFDPVVIKLTKGYEAIVDPVDADLAAFNWHFSNGYAWGHRPTRTSLHRLILERKIGRALISKEEVDHISGDTLDNRRANLRLATYAQNRQNSRLHGTNKSGYKGVSYHKRFHRWRATIQANYQNHHLGYFDTPEEAYAAYCEAAVKYHGEFARFK